MTKEDLLRRLEELGFDRKEYWVVSGGAMVLYGLREKTHDLDLGCTATLADRLENRGYPVTRLPDGTRKIVLAEDVELFENWIYDTVTEVEGVPVISLEGLIAMKKTLGREKDQRDLMLIENFLMNK